MIGPKSSPNTKKHPFDNTHLTAEPILKQCGWLVICLDQVVDWLVICLDQVVPERIRNVWRRSEVGNHKRRTLNSRLSSVSSEHTSSSSQKKLGRMIRSDLFWYWNKLKMKPTYREKNLPDYFFGGFTSTLNIYIYIYINRYIYIYIYICYTYIFTHTHTHT